MYYFNFNFLAERLLITVTKLTMVMVLNGMITAATNGFKFPVTAKLSPIILYKSDSVKLILMI